MLYTTKRQRVPLFAPLDDIAYVDPRFFAVDAAVRNCIGSRRCNEMLVVSVARL